MSSIICFAYRPTQAVYFAQHTYLVLFGCSLYRYADTTARFGVLVVLSWCRVALTVYEYLLSFEAERRVIWGRKVTLPSILFFFNRYLLWVYVLSLVMWNHIDWETDEVRSSLHPTWYAD